MTGPLDEPQVLLDERLCLALYTASRAMTARYRPLLSDLGLTYPQYLVMVTLWEDGESTVRRIGERLSLESSTLSPLLKRLEAMGLLARTRNERDERSVLVSLTAQGVAMRDRAAGVPQEICSASGLSTQAQAALVEQLRTLAARLEHSLAG
jgi:DNA-binding MarR family transcriptional regulator